MDHEATLRRSGPTVPERIHAGGTPTRTGPARKWWYSSWTLLLAAIVIFNAIYALPRYLHFDPTLSRTRIDPSFGLHFPVLVVHVVTGNIALLTLLIQLIPWVRRVAPKVHRVSGRIYVFAGAIPSALLSFALLPYSSAPMGKLGLATMALLWIITTAVGYRMGTKRRYLDHRRWMLYSFALALGTSWGRVISQFAMPGVDIRLDLFFDISSWMGWVVSLILVHWYVERTTPRLRRELAGHRPG